MAIKTGGVIQTGTGEGKVIVPETGAYPTIPTNFLWNSNKNQLECDRDAATAMTGGTFGYEWNTDPDATTGWTALETVSNPASGSVVRSLPDQVADRWYRAWKISSTNKAGPKTVPIQNRHVIRQCLVRGKVGDMVDAPIDATRMEWTYDTTARYIEQKGDKTVIVRRNTIYADDRGAWSERIYRSSITTLNAKFWIITRQGLRIGPFTKVIPDALETNFTDLADAS
jgi:hypothetical protein